MRRIMTRIGVAFVVGVLRRLRVLSDRDSARWSAGRRGHRYV